MQDSTAKPNAAGYLMVRDPDHPTAARGGLVYVHRAVLYDKLGPGAHPCHYCGRLVVWGDTLCGDHLDGDKANNDPANLAPCCHGCNTKAWGQRRTHCKNGHPLNDENTYVPPRYPDHRVCRACRRERMRQYAKPGTKAS